MTKFARLLLVGLLVLNATPCLAFEDKFYFAIGDESNFAELNGTIAEADVSISCESRNAKELFISSKLRADGKEDTFQGSKEESRNYLQKRKQKNLLVIWFGKTIWRTTANEEALKIEYKKYVAGLGFKRVLMLGASAYGTEVIYDSDERPGKGHNLPFAVKFYPLGPTDTGHSRLMTVTNQADLTIHCEGLDEIDVGIGEGDRNGISPIYFKRDQVRHFLWHQRHKDLLVVRFSKNIMGFEPKERKKLIDEYKTFVLDQEYKRVIFLGNSASGTYVLYDSYELPKSEKESDKAYQR